MVTLVLQVLGNSDVKVDGKPGYETLKGSKLADIQYKQEDNQELIAKIHRVEFPLIKKLLDTEGVTKSNTFWCFLLTDQAKWQSARSETGEGWAKVVAKDGIWWQDILGEWCHQNQINHCSIPVAIGPEVPNGAADWDGMAKKIATILAERIKFDYTEERKISFQPKPPEPDKEAITIDKIIVQHSSGTPALTGALYLWGIERKLEAINLEFVYIPDSEYESECELHSGTHWQWHLKVPQIRELLKIQDFSGALQIISSHPDSDQTVKEKLTQLDRAVSLNLTGRENLTGRDGIIERVAIALWSEEAFRTRSQWMHWYLRMAGAFELAILLLLESRGDNKYKWGTNKLIIQVGDIIEVNTIDIYKLVNLLTDGDYTWEFRVKEYPLMCQKIVADEWPKFCQFYIQNDRREYGWDLGLLPNVNVEVFRFGFTEIRNKLYHSLLGDYIDQLLDTKTKQLGSVTHPEHPAQVAVNWLEYIIDLAGLTDEMAKRADYYRQIVQHVEENL